MRTAYSLLAIVLLLGLAAPGTAQQTFRFGTSMIVLDDEIIVGEVANFLRPGTVYVYAREGNGWAETQRLQGMEPEVRDGFGASLALAGGTLFVGQGPEIRMFERDADGLWQMTGSLETPEPEPGVQFGAAVAAEGDWLLIGAPVAAPGGPRGGGPQGAPANRRPGSVHVFRRSADGSWRSAGSLQAPEPTGGDRFGFALTFADGSAIVGAPGAPGADGPGPAAYVFELDEAAGAWQDPLRMQPSSEEEGQGFGSAVARSGDLVVVGAPDHGGGQGAAYLYRHEAQRGAWTQHARLHPFAPGSQDRFGTAVGIDGTDVWVGAPSADPRGSGSTYVFQAEGDERAFVSARRIGLDDTNFQDRFGQRMIVASGRALVAAPGKDHGAGSVAVFGRGDNGDWIEEALLESEDEALPAFSGEELDCEDGTAGVFDCGGPVSLLSYMPVTEMTLEDRGRGARTSDIWGWTDEETGREYAIVGRVDGTSFVDVTDPVNPVFKGDLPQTPGGPPSPVWRDIKVYSNHAYIVADAAGAHGMQVFDLTQLRDVGDEPVLFEPTARYDRINSAHNVVINEESGFAYIVGASGGGETCGGGLHMVDIREPTNPQFAGCFAHAGTGRAGGGYTHDAQCVIWRGPDERYHGREICLGANENAISIADVTDKENPVALSVGTYPNPAYTHQGWLTEDQRYWFVNDELDELQGTVDRTRTLAWDLSDLEDPQLAVEFMGTTGASDHNLYIRGDLMYQSNYRAGLRIIDISDPLEPREVGWLDTSPYLAPEAGFSGTWSNYPFFRSGAIAVSSVHEGLFLVRYRDPEVVFD